jgi:hypothetical protein
VSGGLSEDWLEITARRWAAEDKIIGHARRMTRILNLDPAHVERLESAALRNDGDELDRAIADFLAAAVAAR